MSSNQIFPVCRACLGCLMHQTVGQANGGALRCCQPAVCAELFNGCIVFSAGSRGSIAMLSSSCLEV